MVRLDFEILGLGFDRLPHFGDKHPFARLGSRDASKMGFPLFTLDASGHSSESPFMDAAGAASLIASLNPHRPAPPQEARYIVAGQQPGLLTGPLYTFLKAAGVIALSEKLTREGPGPVLPLFWIAAEDHDVLEVNRIVVNGRRFVHPYDGEIRRGRVPQVGDIAIEEAREPLLAFLRETLVETEFTPWVLDAVASADYTSYATAFEGLMRALFQEHGLRFVTPGALRPLTAPVLAALVEQWPGVSEGLMRGAEMLGSHGFDPPLEAAGFYVIEEGLRVPVEPIASGFRFDQRSCSREETAGAIRSRPMDFSSGAALRSILQDAVLPVAVTMGGPAELLYLWQIRPLYPVIGVTPSLLFPRLSATFVETKIRRAAEKAGLEKERLFEAAAAREAAGGRDEDDPAVEAIRGKARALLDAIGGARGETAPRWLVRSRDALNIQVEKIIRRLREEGDEAQKLDRSRLEKVEAALVPKGKPQERMENILYFVNLYGPDFVRLVLDRLDPLSEAHQVVFIGTKG